MPQEARKGKFWGGTSMRASKQTLQASVLSVHCLQMKNWGTKCTFILVVVQPTVAQSSFHTEILSSIRFSTLLFLQRRKRTKNFLAFSLFIWILRRTACQQQQLTSYKNHQIKNSSRACLSFNWNITLQFTLHVTGGVFLFRDDRNLSMHHWKLVRFINSFSLPS